MLEKITLLSPQLSNFEQNDFRKYVVIAITCFIGVLGHLGFALFFFFSDIWILSISHVSNATLWGWAAIINFHGQQSRAIFLISLFALIEIIFLVSYLGLGSGFQLYLWPVACLVVINPKLRKGEASLIAFGFIVLFAFMKYFFGDIENHPQLSGSTDSLYMINAMIAGIPVILGIASVRQINETQEKALIELATIDELTGLYNRRYANSYLNRYAVGPDALPFSMVLGDIDYFKKINDNFGHGVGDEVLCIIAKQLKECFRSTDVICRWGGEEFLIILYETEPEKAYYLVDEAREKISKSVKAKGVGFLKVTMSFGIAGSTDCRNYEELIKQADENLYQAKNSGRDCVVISAPADESEKLVGTS